MGLVGGRPTPLKNDGVKVSWDYILFPIYGKIKVMFQTANQGYIDTYGLMIILKKLGFQGLLLMYSMFIP